MCDKFVSGGSSVCQVCVKCVKYVKSGYHLCVKCMSSVSNKLKVDIKCVSRECQMCCLVYVKCAKVVSCVFSVSMVCQP